MLRSLRLYRNRRASSLLSNATALTFHRQSVQMFSDEKRQTRENASQSAKKSLVNTAKNLGKSIIDAARNPRASWNMVKDVAHHYWVGSKLLWNEVKIASQILSRLFQGHGMTRRERMQLLRTTSDVFRLVPFAVFVIVPFMEFLLPFALKLFPNMLPSTFQDNLKKEEALKQELQMRLAVAKFMQETLQKMASKKSNSMENDSSGAKEVIDFIEKARLGEAIGNDTVIRIAQLFKDELTLANIARPQLVSMCRYMGLQPYGADAFLRFQLRTKFKGIKEDDRRILWEGLDSLNATEMRDACSERGMRSYGMTYYKLKIQLQEWLNLSIQKNIPISLLIMSRAFMLTSPSDDPEQILKSSMSSLDSDTINEVVIAVASAGEENTMDIRLRKLDSIQFQKEMIQEEREEKEDALDSFNIKEVGAGVVDAATEGPRHTELLSDVDPIIVDEVKHNKNEKKELTVYEMRAISDLARGSSVLREKTELAVLQSNVEYVNSENAYDKGSNTDNSSQSGAIADVTMSPEGNKKELSLKDENSGDDKGLVRMKHVVSTMLDKLKTRIDTTEKALGDSLNLLDKDGDGEISSEELKEAIVKIIKRASSLKEAEELILTLDSNNDGRVSLAELLAYIEKKSDSAEVEALEARLKSPQWETKDSTK